MCWPEFEKKKCLIKKVTTIFLTFTCQSCLSLSGSRDSLLVRAPDSWSKGCEFGSRLERRENFLLQSQLCELTLIRCPSHSRVTAVARKRPRLFCQNCRWQVTSKHAYTLDPSKSEWADYAAVQAESWSLSGNELTRNSSGNTRAILRLQISPVFQHFRYVLSNTTGKSC